MENENNVNLDTTNETVQETVETPVIETTEEVAETTTEVDNTHLQATNKKLFERAKKAEAEVKALRASQPVNAKSVSPQLDPVEAALLVSGMSEELLGELKAVASVRKVSLIKAQNDPIFVAVKEKLEKDKKHQDASLPASKGAGSVRAKKDFTTPGLSREEHIALVKQNR